MPILIPLTFHTKPCYLKVYVKIIIEIHLSCIGQPHTVWGNGMQPVFNTKLSCLLKGALAFFVGWRSSDIS